MNAYFFEWSHKGMTPKTTFSMKLLMVSNTVSDRKRTKQNKTLCDSVIMVRSGKIKKRLRKFDPQNI